MQRAEVALLACLEQTFGVAWRNHLIAFILESRAQTVLVKFRYNCEVPVQNTSSIAA
jgi:hypothetical protein